MDANGHQRRRIIWAIVAFATFAWIRLSSGLENMIYIGASIHNDPYQATVLENVGAIGDGLVSIASMLPVLCFTLFKVCTGVPLMIFAIGMVLYHSIKMGRVASETGSDQPPSEATLRKEKSKHG